MTDLDEKTLILRYRAHLTYPLEAMLITLALGDMMVTDDNLELIKRCAMAVKAQDSFTALNSILK